MAQPRWRESGSRSWSPRRAVEEVELTEPRSAVSEAGGDAGAAGAARAGEVQAVSRTSWTGARGSRSTCSLAQARPGDGSGRSRPGGVAYLDELAERSRPRRSTSCRSPRLRQARRRRLPGHGPCTLVEADLVRWTAPDLGGLRWWMDTATPGGRLGRRGGRGSAQGPRVEPQPRRPSSVLRAKIVEGVGRGPASALASAGSHASAPRAPSATETLLQPEGASSPRPPCRRQAVEAAVGLAAGGLAARLLLVAQRPGDCLQAPPSASIPKISSWATSAPIIAGAGAHREADEHLPGLVVFDQVRQQQRPDDAAGPVPTAKKSVMPSRGSPSGRSPTPSGTRRTPAEAKKKTTTSTRSRSPR